MFPRSPHRRLRGRDKTYYLSKDIRFLQHEPLLEHVRQFRVWKRRLQKAKARGEQGLVQNRDREASFPIRQHLRERDPTFDDALRIWMMPCVPCIFARLSSQRTIPPHGSIERTDRQRVAGVHCTHSLRRCSSLSRASTTRPTRGAGNVARTLDLHNEYPARYRRHRLNDLPRPACGAAALCPVSLVHRSRAAYPPAAVATAADAPAPFATVALAKLEAGAESGREVTMWRLRTARDAAQTL